MKPTVNELKRNICIMAAEYHKTLSELAQEKKRLDFVLSNSAFIYKKISDSRVTTFQIWSQDEDENFFALHNDDLFFKSERDAIDASILSAEEND